VMEELGNSQGPRTDAVGAHCREFMLAMKVTSLLRALAACLPISLSFPLLRLNPR
jgi:mediator of RNA polymerase II transcription subunit 11